MNEMSNNVFQQVADGHRWEEGSQESPPMTNEPTQPQTHLNSLNHLSGCTIDIVLFLLLYVADPLDKINTNLLSNRCEITCFQTGGHVVGVYRWGGGVWGVREFLGTPGPIPPTYPPTLPPPSYLAGWREMKR